MRLQRLIWALIGALVLSAGMGVGAPSPRVRALLVGVSDYLYLDADLRGPRNDVRLMRQTLLARGVAPDQIRVLSQDDTVPTRAAILGALDDLAADSRPGDQVLFYFSGHGSQAPDISGDELGGYDEIFLPADASGWSDSSRSVENAILDDEFQDRAAAILATGASLVVILDACHAATGFRALGGQGVARTIAPSLLNIPDGIDAKAGAGAAAARLTGDFVFLYAAQADERAFEYPLGADEDPANWYGGFTRILAQTLQATPDLTWQQAMQAAQAAIRQAGGSQTPDAEGPLFGAPVFGTATPPPARMALRGKQLQAGLLAGVHKGAVLAIYADATAQDVVARGVISRIDARTGVVEITEGSAPKAGFAVQTTPGLPPKLRFSTPMRADPEDGFDYGPLQDALAQVVQSDALDAVEYGGQPFDIGLVLTGGALALTGGDGVLDPDGAGSSLRVDAADLPDALDRAARVHRLRAALALGGNSGMSALMRSQQAVSVEVGHRKAQTVGAPCGQVSRKETRPVREGYAIAPCDQLWVHLKNTSPTAQDITVLYADADNHVTALWPTGSLSNRLAFNEQADVGVQIVQGDSDRGREELIVIAVPAVPGAPRVVLTGLADPAASRAARSSPVADYLLSAADPGQSSRGFSTTAALAPVDVTRIGFRYGSARDE